MAKKANDPFCYAYPRPAVTVDVVLVSREDKPRVLLIKRAKPPFEDCWALPGGFVDAGETLEQAARRELLEETGVVCDELEQLYTAGDPGRDPRGWTISVVYLGRVNDKAMTAEAADDAKEVKWHSLSRLPKLAFDHAMILHRAKCRLQDRTA